jgi:hypothetical protein
MPASGARNGLATRLTVRSLGRCLHSKSVIGCRYQTDTATYHRRRLRVCHLVMVGRAESHSRGPGPSWKSSPVALPGGREISVQVSEDEELAYLDKLKERFEKANPGSTFKVTRRTIAPHDPVEVTHPVSWPLKLWPRFGVKVALNVGRALWGEEWLESDHGMLLHRILWDKEIQVGANAFPNGKVPGAGLAGYEPGPDHVLYVNTAMNGEPMLLIQLFGEQTYGVQLGPFKLPEKTVWILHVHQRTSEHISLDEFFGRIIIVAAET